MYDDDAMLREFGRIQITRASNIRWDEEEQKWRIWLIHPGGEEVRTDDAFTDRGEAIQAEIDMLDRMLVSSETTVEKMFTEKK